MSWSILGLKIAEFLIIKGLDYLVEHPKFGIGNKLAKIILTSASKSKHNNIKDEMIEDALKVL